MMFNKIQVLIPVFNDLESLSKLTSLFDSCIDQRYLERLSITIVDDGSTIPLTVKSLPTRFPIQIVRLTNNLGHQRAIAIGLSFIAKQAKPDAVIVMDGDGEDAPASIPQLIEALSQHLDRIVFARRARRYDGFYFQIFYQIYKGCFKCLTGKPNVFGNFCIIPASSLEYLVNVSNIWNNFPGGIIQSKLPYTSVPIDRANRLAGKSKMNFTALVIHGLSAVAAQMDVVAVRIFFLSTLLTVISFIGFLIVFGLKVFSGFMISKEGIILGLGLGVIFIQSFLVSLFLVFVILTQRNQNPLIPAKDYERFVRGVENG